MIGGAGTHPTHVSHGEITMQLKWLAAMVFACVLGAVADSRAGAKPGGRDVDLPKGVPAEAKIRLVADKERYFLGENVLLHYEVQNTGGTPFALEYGGDERGSPRPLRMRVSATDEAGNEAVDPTPDPMNFGGPVGRPSIEPGQSFFAAVPVMRHRLFEKPGKYTIRAVHDLGWGERDERGKIADNDARRVSVQIEFVMPDAAQAAAIVADMEANRDTGGSFGKRRAPYADFTCLRYPVYLPSLQRMIEKNDPRAMQALSMMFTPEATRVIVVGLMSENADLADAAVRALQGRLPMGSRKHYISEAQHQRQLEVVAQSWRDEFAEPVAAYARKALAATPREGMRDRRMEEAARLLEAVGPASELATVTLALDRMLARSKEVPVESPLIYGVIPNLQWAATAILQRGAKASGNPSTPGEIAVYLEAAKLAKAAPEGLDAWQEKWISHPLPYVQRLTIETLKAPFPAWLNAKLMERVNSPDVEVQYAAVNAAAKLKDRAFGPVMLKVMRTATDRWVTDGAGIAAAASAVPRDEIMLAWADRITLPEPAKQVGASEFFTTMGRLFVLIEHQGSGTRSGFHQQGGEDRVALRARWVEFIEKNRDAIREGKNFKASGPEVSPELVPRSLSIYVDRKEWPPTTAPAN